MALYLFALAAGAGLDLHGGRRPREALVVDPWQFACAGGGSEDGDSEGGDGEGSQ